MLIAIIIIILHVRMPKDFHIASLIIITVMLGDVMTHS